MQVKAMAFQRKEVEQKIRNLAPIFAQHILKMFLYPNSQFTKGWEKELKSWYDSSKNLGHKIKGGKSLSEEEYFDCLFFPLRPLKKLYRAVVADNRELSPLYLETELPILDSMVSGLYLALAEALANKRDWILMVRDLREFTGIDG
jgi:hypothetical protein